MNYCILNGINSKTIRGLLIQELPSITKPRMRTSVEEIDGRDGDIVTFLGFAAYNKTIKIGLYGDYDINEIIKFFNSEGIVTFSNESDKFYRYKIVEHIDFERLARFKTASVVFHVEPFKYSSVEGEVGYDPNILKISDWQHELNGVEVFVKNQTMHIAGETTADTEFYIPINELSLGIGYHKWEMFTEGTGESNCRARLIYDNPANHNSFNKTFIVLLNDGYSMLEDILEETKVYNFIYIFIEKNKSVNFRLRTRIIDTTKKILNITNNGNIESKPQLRILGEGTIQLSLNNKHVLIIEMGAAGYITIDVEQMNAYHGEMLMNRYVEGDYNKLKLPPGKNEITWSGNVTEIYIKNYSRWI